MDILKISLLSFFSIIVLFILTKLMGNREMSQLSMFDYIVGITIGSIAAEMATSLENNFIEPLVAMIIYAVVTIFISFITCKSIKIRRIISGKTLILLDKGKFYRKNFKKAKLDINEFLMQCRINGYFNISDIETALLEPNGKISFLPVNLKRPATPLDFNLNPQKERIVANVIVDGVLLNENLKFTGHDENWLEKQMKEQNVSDIHEVFLATVDVDNNLSIYIKLPKENSHDSFE